MLEHSPRAYLLMSAAIAGALLAGDLVELATTGRIPPGELRRTAFAAATLFAALGLASRHTHRTLELARRIEHARLVRRIDTSSATFPVPVGTSRATVDRPRSVNHAQPSSSTPLAS